MDNITKDLIREFIPCYAPRFRLPEGLTLDDAKQMYYDICLIREFEKNARDLWRAGQIRGLCHGYDYAEAIAVGACRALANGDYITSTHRGHGHMLARGALPALMYAELFGKSEGYNCGKGGSMHIADVERGILGATGIVGSGIAPATGAAFSAKLLKNGRVSLCFFGDGATNQGAFFESLNMAAAWDLPVIYVCEYNQWAIGTDYWRVTKQHDAYKRAEGFGMPGVQVDGFDTFAVYDAVRQAAARAREGKGPTLIEARFMRMLGHHAGDDQSYREPQDIERIKVLYEIEPVKRTCELLEFLGVPEEALEAIKHKAYLDIADALAYAKEQCSEPDLDVLYQDIYADGEIIR